ncbi:MAG: mucoidy inhibitor MuiA family protein [Cellulophaga sp.]
MKKILILLTLFPFLIFGNDTKLPSKIKEVTVYLNGAQITRLAHCQLKIGTSEITFTGLSPKIDESSIQISGLQWVSILAMSYDINYLEKSTSSPETLLLEKQISSTEAEISSLKNLVLGLQEEENVIKSNSLIRELDLEKIKRLSTYYRERITAIKNEIFATNSKVNTLRLKTIAFKKQLAEFNNTPEKKKGELTLKFDAPIASNLNLKISYTIQDAGWIPNYDIKSKKINAPLQLSYKAHVYQKTGNDWNNVKITLATGTPYTNVVKPILGAKHLNFVSRYNKRKQTASIGRKKYYFNPSVKTVSGIVTDESGEPLSGCTIVIKGTSTGVQTDFDGHYSIKIKNGKKLEYSFIGQKSQIIPVYASLINVRLDTDASTLEEVVVVGYGKATENVFSSLQGRVSGVQIRGNSTIRAPKLPLYIIDGIPVKNYTEGDLNENEIQSMQVLKKGEASELYGSQGKHGIIVITTKKSVTKDGITNTKFSIKKPYSIASDGDITAIEINTFKLAANYTYFAAPIINENVFLTATFADWEQYNLLPGEASIYFDGSYAGKTTIDPYQVTKEMTISLGIDPSITVARKQDKNFKSRSFSGSNRILNRNYTLEIKNNKTVAISLQLLDRIPISQNKEIKVGEIETYDADYNKKKGVLTWELQLAPKESEKKQFSFQVKYPKYKTISL